jgi:hypothetical protein
MQNRTAGFIKAVLVIVIALIVLGYFGFRLDDIFGREAVAHNLSVAWGFVKRVWNNYLLRPTLWIWNTVIVELIWNHLRELLN